MLEFHAGRAARRRRDQFTHPPRAVSDLQQRRHRVSIDVLGGRPDDTHSDRSLLGPQESEQEGENRERREHDGEDVPQEQRADPSPTFLFLHTAMVRDRASPFNR
jgi:hypothetical protein